MLSKRSFSTRNNSKSQLDVPFAMQVGALQSRKANDSLLYATQTKAAQAIKDKKRNKAHHSSCRADDIGAFTVTDFKLKKKSVTKKRTDGLKAV